MDLGTGTGKSLFTRLNTCCGYHCIILCPQEPTADHLTEAIQALVTEQQDISQKAAKTTPSLSRLHHRLVVMERYILALSRKGAVPCEPSDAGEAGEGVEEEKEEIDGSEKEEGVKPLEVKKEPVVEKKTNMM